MVPRTRIARPLGWMLLAVAGSLVSCGEGDSSGEVIVDRAPAVEFLEARAIGAETPPEAPVIVRRLRVEEPTDWKVQGCQSRVVPFRDSGEIGSGFQLVLERFDRGVRLFIEGPFDPSTFNQVAVHLRALGRPEIQLRFFAKGKPVPFINPHPVDPGRGRQTILFDAPQLRGGPAELDRLLVRISGGSDELKIFGLDLLHQPDLAFLPDPALGPQLVLIRQEARCALGVSTGRPLGTTLRAAPGRSLRFSYGIPRELIHRDRQASLRVRLEGRNGEVREETQVLDSRPSRARWRQSLVPLDGFGEQQVDVRWEVVGPEGAGETVCAVGEISVVRRASAGAVVLLISSDTHRGDHLGAAPDGVGVATPAIDALASRGILFEDCFSSTNITNPSHIAMMTGTHPRDLGIVNNFTRVSGDAPTLAEAFRNAGYLTYGAVSVQHLGDPISGLGQGFERFSYPVHGFARDGEDAVADVQEWLRESPGMPIFIWLHVFDAHGPYAPEGSDVQLYYTDPQAAFDESLPALDPAAEKVLGQLDLKGLRDLDYPRALYRAEISGLDRVLGGLLEMPELADAIVGLTGDHGESLGGHRIYFGHEELYRESLHVPLILAWRGGPQGVRYPHGVMNLDLGRTLLDLSGHRDVRFPGRNLVALVDRESIDDEPRFTLSAHAQEAALTQGGWHLQLRLRHNLLGNGEITREKHRVELYYLPDDPTCTTDLLDEELGRARKMRGLLLRWLDQRVSTGWLGGETRDHETAKNLQALGYTGGQDSDPMDLDLKLDPGCECEWCGRFR